MRVRDAGEDDAEAVATITGLSTAAARRLIRERSVRLAERSDDGGADETGSEEGAAALGVVAFDAGREAVEVTRLDGAERAVARLLEEPVRFARSEGLAVEVVVPAGVETARRLEERGFEERGGGPRFEGERTRRYRLPPE